MGLPKFAYRIARVFPSSQFCNNFIDWMTKNSHRIHHSAKCQGSYFPNSDTGRTQIHLLSGKSFHSMSKYHRNNKWERQLSLGIPLWNLCSGENLKPSHIWYHLCSTLQPVVVVFLPQSQILCFHPNHPLLTLAAAHLIQLIEIDHQPTMGTLGTQSYRGQLLL